ncbi:uncharacterized protein LOC131724722 [Acipenser ruthenus]|uniref:uncharacterized protein LOC131724722 n=1 Tax=Acipenser ruthenus TaxID=7906 RepID=UPI0027408FA1|nr:uncharacterized protein LOC131724722 [Acipenser ruthenus]
MSSVGNETVEMAALGRPFQLGMLYDCRKDSLIPGITLWDPEELKKDTEERSQPKTEFSVTASDSIEDKASALKASAALKASLMGGLVEIEGAAKYFNDTKKSKKQSRVTLTYHTTTRYEQLTMKHLGEGKVSHKRVFEDGTATHVVTAVLYGADAYFVFDREVSTDEKQQHIEGNMKVAINKLKAITIEGEGSLDMTDTEMDDVKKFSCTFHGDFRLGSNPSTFQDAVQVYKTLPKLLGDNGEHAVPVKVWLYPLMKLDSKAARLVRNISDQLVTCSQTALEQLHAVEMQCNDMIEDIVPQTFPEVKEKIQQLKQMSQQYKLSFMRQLASALPAIRGGGQEEGVLAEVLQHNEESPFNNKSLKMWLDRKEREINVVGSFLTEFEGLNQFKGVHAVSSVNKLERAVLDRTAEKVVCFTFTSLHEPEPYLSALSNYLNPHLKKSTPSVTPDTYTQQDSNHWVCDESIQKMICCSDVFLELVKINKDNEKTKFLIASKPDKKFPGAGILLYEKRSFKGTYFEPPSKPDTPEVCGVTHDSVTLKLIPPSSDANNKVTYRVEYKCTDQEDWIIKTNTPTVSGLQANTEYEFRYTAVGMLGYPVSSDTTSSVKTLPTSAPGKPSKHKATPSSITITWEKPSVIGDGVTIHGYKIEYRRNEASKWTETTTDKEEYTLEDLDEKASYIIRVSCDCGELGSSAASEEAVIETALKMNIEKDRTLCTKIKGTRNPSIYKLTLEKETSGHFHKLVFGRKPLSVINRTIMVLGATGSGKTTLINGMINYILGVEWEDDFRFKLINEETNRSQAHSQTSEVTAYQIYHKEGFKVPHSLTIIDTPGFGDTKGIQQDKLIIEKMREFFSSPNGIDSIDAVCFVVQAALARLTHTQKYIFDSILSIFGNDIENNIQLLVTFADGKAPPVLDAINAAGVPCPKSDTGVPVHFKFNNSVLFEPNAGGSEDGFDRMFWKMGSASMKNFFNNLDSMETRSLQLTKEVLAERKQLQVSVEGLQPMIKVGLSKLDEIRETQAALERHKHCIEANKDFEYEVEITVPKQIDISGTGRFITNCQKCHYTCHYPCAIVNDKDKNKCCAMNSEGFCTVCPGNCDWSVHFNQKYRWVYETTKEKRTYEDLKKQYEDAKGKKMSAEEIVKTLEQEFSAVKYKVLGLIEQLSQSLSRLQAIALRPNPLATPDYIDLLIQSEEQEANPGFKERMQSLRQVREGAVILQKVARGENLLPEEKKELKQSKMEVVKGIFTDFKDWVTGGKKNK